MSFINSVYKVINYFLPDKLVYLIILMIITSILELSALVLFAYQLSFIGGIFSIDDSQSNLSFLNDLLEDNNQFALIMMILIIIFSLLSRLLLIWSSNLFSQNIRAQLSKNEFIYFSNQKISASKEKDLGSYSSDILSEVDVIIQAGILPFLKFINSIIAIAILMSGLFVIGNIYIFFGYIIYLAIYFFIFAISRPIVSRNASIRKKNNEQRFNLISNAFKNYKFLSFNKLFGSYAKELENYSSIMGKAQAKTNSVAEFPRSILESVTFLIVLFVFAATLTNSASSSILFETLFLFGASALRFLPALQLSYASIASMRSIIPSIDAVNSRLTSTVKNTKYLINVPSHIHIKNLTFKHDKKYIFKNFSEIINIDQFTLLSGKSGSGKSTLVDLMLSFLKPESGDVTWGYESISHPSSLKKFVSYIPQEPVIFGKSVMENILLQADKQENLDEKKLSSILDLCQISNFCTLDDLHSQLNIDKLSGGQKQRIGLARALISNPEYLIIDEGFSGIDHNSTKDLIQSLKKLDSIKGMLLISHNEKLKECFDKIIYINELK